MFENNNYIKRKELNIFGNRLLECTDGVYRKIEAIVKNISENYGVENWSD